jgi:hypothetical protein
MDVYVEGGDGCACLIGTFVANSETSSWLLTRIAVLRSAGMFGERMEAPPSLPVDYLPIDPRPVEGQDFGGHRAFFTENWS